MEDLKAFTEYVIGSLAPAVKHEVPADALNDVLFDRPVHRAPQPLADPLAKELRLSTLSSMADYVKANVDDIELGEYLIHVESPIRVALLSALEPYHRRREVVVAAIYEPEKGIVDTWVDLETATIGLITGFAPSAERDRLLSLVKGVRRENAEVREDDGLAQKVTMRAGAQLVQTASTANPVLLAPFRTFAEATQPTSPFILRLRDTDGMGVLLKSADGGAWKVSAVTEIKAALERLLQERGVEAAPAIIC